MEIILVLVHWLNHRLAMMVMPNPFATATFIASWLESSMAILIFSPFRAKARTSTPQARAA
jgi:hypothetical protein